jgi:hypothetical protein
MTGPEHYRAAEELLAEITNDDGTVGFGDGGEAFAAAAQVHATLALAAATALPHVRADYPADEDAWYQAAAVPEPKS